MGIWSELLPAAAGVATGVATGNPALGVAAYGGVKGAMTTAEGAEKMDAAAQAARDAANGVTAPKVDRTAYETPRQAWGPDYVSPEQIAAQADLQDRFGKLKEAGADWAKIRAEKFAEYQAKRLEEWRAQARAYMSLGPMEKAQTSPPMPPDIEGDFAKLEAEGKLPGQEAGNLANEELRVAAEKAYLAKQRDDSDQVAFAHAAQDVANRDAPELARTAIDWSGAKPYEANALIDRAKQDTLLAQSAAQDAAMSAQQSRTIGSFQGNDAALSAQQAAQLGGFQAADAAALAGQQGLASRLERDLDGRGGPSLAEAQLHQATQRNMMQQAAMVAGAGPQDYLAARRAAIQAGVLAQQQEAQQAAVLRAGEYAKAREEMGAALTQQRTGTTQAFNAAAGALEAQRQGTTQAFTSASNALEAQRQGGATMAATQGNIISQQQNANLTQASQAYTNATNTAYLEKDQNVAQLEAELKQRGLNDTQVANFLQAYQNAQTADRNADMRMTEFNANADLEAQRIKAGLHGNAVQAQMGAAQATTATGTSIIGAAGAMGAAGLSKGSSPAASPTPQATAAPVPAQSPTTPSAPSGYGSPQPDKDGLLYA